MAMFEELALLSPAEMAKADRHAIEAGTSGLELMQRAGEAVARVALRAMEQGGAGRRDVIVLCGPGNNGGDGFVAARLLTERGVSVSVALLGSDEALRGDAAAARRLFSGPIEDATRTALDDAGLIVDALFGAGLFHQVANAQQAVRTFRPALEL